jgi:ribosomal protein S18 acetylase RimI-like enzyme
MGIVIRPLAERDGFAVREILHRCGVFSGEEVTVALDLMEKGVAGGLAGRFPLFAADVDGVLAGYVCIGRAPLTDRTWELYWIAVHPALQARGVGRCLQAHAEAFIRSLGGERLVLETSSRDVYERTRRFYRQAGFVQVGLIPDFYRRGDDCLILCKLLTLIPNA